MIFLHHNTLNTFTEVAVSVEKNQCFDGYVFATCIEVIRLQYQKHSCKIYIQRPTIQNLCDQEECLCG